MPASTRIKRRQLRKLEYNFQRRGKPHIELRHQTFVAVLEIPERLRSKIGRVRFVKSLKTDSASVAERRAQPLITAWRREIAEARGENASSDDSAFLRHALRSAKSETERANILASISERANEIAVQELMESDGSRAASVAQNFEARAIRGPFDELVAEWHATSRVTEKTKDMQVADIKRFAVKFPTAGDVNKPAVKRWIGGLMADGKLTAKTVQRILSALRGYWRHLQSVGAAPDELEPFTGLNLATQGGRVSRDDRRQAFAPGEVVRLLAEARTRDDDELVDLIEIARWSGARIEEICALKIENVRLKSKIPHFTVAAGKTDAAIRDVPVHHDLQQVLERLIGDRPTGYVLADLTENKYHDRSNAIGKRFGYLKTALGFGEQFVFHSLRKTVASMFKDASVPEFVAADILGHEIMSMSYGLYAADVSLETKAKAIGKLTYRTTAPGPARMPSGKRARANV